MTRPAQAQPGRIGDAYRYFSNELVRSSDKLSEARHSALGRLAVVSITLEAGDDPHLIFESLNAKGERLTQADLLRNYFLMRLPPGTADPDFARLWQPMQQKLGEDLTSFFRHYLMRDVEGAEVRKDEVYDHVKERIDRDAADPSAVVTRLEEVHSHASNYARLVRPAEYESAVDVAATVSRLHRLKVTTAYPFLMNVMEAIYQRRLSTSTFPAVLDLIENFLVRRLACGVPTNQLRVIFRGLCGEAASAISDEEFVLGLRAALRLNQRCPTDAAFKDAISRRPLYTSSKRDAARYILERIERSFEHKETPDPQASNVQLEHVLPQTLTEEWETELLTDIGIPAVEIHGQWLQTLGNLTLTAYNPELSNQPFDTKKKAFAESNFSLNGYFDEVTQWNATAIAARGCSLADRALTIWPDFAPAQATAEKIAEDRIRRRRVPPPAAVIINGSRHLVKSSLDATRIVVREMHNIDAERFERALTKAFPKTRRGSLTEFMRAPREIYAGCVIDLHGSGSWLRQRCRRIVASMGLPPSALEFEERASE